MLHQVDPLAPQGERVRSMMDQFLPNKPDSAMLPDFTNETVTCSQVEEEMVKSFFAPTAMEDAPWIDQIFVG